MAVNRLTRAFATGIAVAEFSSLTVGDCAQNVEVSAPDEFMQPSLDVLLVNDGKHSYLSVANVQKEIDKVDEALRYSTDGARSLGSVVIHETVEAPEGKVRWGNKEYACYTKEQFNTLHAQQREKSVLGGKAIAVIAYNSALSCDVTKAAAWAVQDRNDPRIMANFVFSAKEVLLHEIGHLLGPNAKGLGHESLLNCVVHDENGELKMAYNGGTIQQLLREGCSLQTYKEGENAGKPNPYASYYTVMARNDIFYDKQKPSFSPPELVSLNPGLRTELIDPVPGKYYLSYEKGATFAVKLALPKDHELRKLVPDADGIVFGPVFDGLSADSMEKASLTNPENSLKMMPFLTSSRSKETVAIDTTFFSELPSSSRYEQYKEAYPEAQASDDGIINHLVMYADEKLGKDGIAVIAGIDENGTYVQVFDLPVVASLVERMRDEVKRRNNMIVPQQDTSNDRFFTTVLP